MTTAHPSRWPCGNRPPAAPPPTRAWPTGRLAALESIDVVYSQSWQYDDAAPGWPSAWAPTPARRRYSGIGGSVPLVLAADVARDIATRTSTSRSSWAPKPWPPYAGSRRRARSPRGRSSRPRSGPSRWTWTFDPSEITHSVFEAYLTFALSTTPVGATSAGGSASIAPISDGSWRPCPPSPPVSAGTPGSPWPAAPARSPRQRGQPHGGLPLHQAHDLDHGCRHGVRRAAGQRREGRRARCTRGQTGVPARLRLRRGARARGRSPRAVAVPRHGRRRRAALDAAGIGIDDVAHLDLYSCFASSICFALDALGIAVDDDRASAVTQTGGLPYHGGPGSNYVTHSIAAMAETLRADPGATAWSAGWACTCKSTPTGSGRAIPARARSATRRLMSHRGVGGHRRLTRGPGHRGHLLGAARAPRRAERALLICDLPALSVVAAAMPTSRAGPRPWPGPRPTKWSAAPSHCGPTERATWPRWPEPVVRGPARARMVAGVDGCRQGWLVATVPVRRPRSSRTPSPGQGRH